MMVTNSVPSFLYSDRTVSEVYNILKDFGAKILDPLVAVSIEKYSYLIKGLCQKINLYYLYNFPNKILQKLKGEEFKFLSKV